MIRRSHQAIIIVTASEIFFDKYMSNNIIDTEHFNADFAECLFPLSADACRTYLFDDQTNSYLRIQWIEKVY